MTLKELVDSINSRIIAPSGGTNGQLLTLGSSGPSWQSHSRTVNASALVIDGREYGVRTGTAGASGFLTISQNTIWLDGREVTLDLGGKEVTAIYQAGTEIYSADTGYYRVYYNGDQNGITWRGNYLPRPQYTQYGYYNLANENVSAGYLYVYIGAQGSDFTHNAHVISAKGIPVPARATTMHCYCRNENTNAINMQFGLLPTNAPNSYSTANGGVLSSAFSISGTTWQDCKLTLPASVKGTTNLRAIVNGRGVANVQRAMRIAWIWFD